MQFHFFFFWNRLSSYLAWNASVEIACLWSFRLRSKQCVLFRLMYSLHLLLLQLYLTFHSYGQYILYPWGYARRDTLDKKDLHNLGVKGAQAVRSLSGRKYSVGSAAKMLYPAAGT